MHIAKVQFIICNRLQEAGHLNFIYRLVLIDQMQPLQKGLLDTISGVSAQKGRLTAYMWTLIPLLCESKPYTGEQYTKERSKDDD